MTRQVSGSKFVSSTRKRKSPRLTVYGIIDNPYHIDEDIDDTSDHVHEPNLEEGLVGKEKEKEGSGI